MAWRDKTYTQVSLYALMLAAAGIPIYIHVPRFASVELGMSLGTIAVILLMIRLVDLVQDPVFGWMVDRYPKARPVFAAGAMVLLAVGLSMLFSLQAGAHVGVWLTVILILVFSAYSLGMILLYGSSASLSSSDKSGDLMRLASYREVGMLVGVIFAAALPSLLAGFSGAQSSYPLYGWALGIMALIAAIGTRHMWRKPAAPSEGLSFAQLRSSGALGLLLLLFINSLPVAMTSTLFLFFVEDKLGLSGMSGAFLILFFLTAGATVPLWTKASHRFGPKRTLLSAMCLAIASFLGAAFLGAGDGAAFAVICLMSGAALGADMVLLPALFSIVLTRAKIDPSTAFGWWSLVGKIGLAVAAFTLLPWLEMVGFEPNTENTPAALERLTLAYAVIPLFLKLGAIALVLRLSILEKDL